MATQFYNSFKGKGYDSSTKIDVAGDTIKCALLTSSYTPNIDTHDFFDDLTNEVSGTGYTAGGQTVAVTVTNDTTNDRCDIGIGNPAGWTGSTITARAGVVYKSRGGASSADELVFYLDFGADITSTAGTFSVSVTSPLRIQN